LTAASQVAHLFGPWNNGILASRLNILERVFSSLSNVCIPKTQYGGRGLGWPDDRSQIVHQHGGRFGWIELREGSTFFFTLASGRGNHLNSVIIGPESILTRSLHVGR